MKPLEELDVEMVLNHHDVGRLIDHNLHDPLENLSFSTHALNKIDERGLITEDCINALKYRVWIAPAEFENGSYRYRISTHKLCVVIAFVSVSEIRVVTAWRISA